MGSHDPFGHFKHKLWPKERSGIKLVIDSQPVKLVIDSQPIKLVIDSRPLKVRNCPDFLACKGRVTYR